MKKSVRKPVRIKFIGDAAEEFERLNKVVGEEKKKGIKNSRSQQLFKSIKKAIELLRQNPPIWNLDKEKFNSKEISCH